MWPMGGRHAAETEAVAVTGQEPANRTARRPALHPQHPNQGSIVAWVSSVSCCFGFLVVLSTRNFAVATGGRAVATQRPTRLVSALSSTGSGRG